MNYPKACKILGLIDDSDISIETVRKQYKLMALKYHPDKNASPDASDKYREIKESHDYLLNHLHINHIVKKIFIHKKFWMLLKKN